MIIKPHQTNEKLSNMVDYWLIGTLAAILVSFFIWSNFTHLDLVTRGTGRVVAIGENKSVQAPESGSIVSFNVKKGQKVSANQLLATISRTEAIGVLEEYETRLENLNIQLIRVDAELAKSSIRDLSNSLINFSREIVNNQIELFKARAQELATQTNTLLNEKDKFRKQGEVLKSEKNGLLELKKLVMEEIDEIFPLVKEGIIGKSEKFRLERESAKLDSEIAVNKNKQEQNNFAIEKIENSIESIERKNLKELYENRSKIYSEILELKSRIPTLNEKISALEIRSPIEGKVNTVFFNNKGAVIREGDILAEIVPTDSGLQIEAFIDPKDIGFIEPGQKVKISLTAYDASKYGYLSGELLQIAPDTIFREESNSSQYSVIVSIQSKILDNENSEADISPGMIAQVDIIRGRRSILEYFWQPVAKIKETAFKE